MYPSSSYYDSNNNITDNLISSSYIFDQTSHNKSSIYEINPNSKQEDHLPHSLYFNIPSPCSHYENDDVLMQYVYDFYLQQQSQIAEVNAPDLITAEMHEHSDNINEILGDCSIKQDESVVIKETPKKKTSKKDRHSKIETAQGPRDRRMRLSLQVARDFFDLQDTLGYNKASKTVEWLLIKSKDAIKDLSSCSANSPSSNSECEVLSREKVKNLVSSSKDTKSTKGSARKSAFNPLAKESREKARERARERTKERKKGHVSKSDTKYQMNPLGSEDDNNGFQVDMVNEVGELSSSMIFNYDMHNNGVPQEHQFTDFNLYGKPWDAYNNSNLC